MVLGRLLSLAFTVIFLAAIAWLAARPDRRLLRAAVAVEVALIAPAVLSHASDGLTDVPAAAMVALAAVVVWTVPDRSWRPAMIATVALLAVLTKPSALVGVGALLAAQLVGERTTLRRRIEREIAPLALGLAVGLAYDWSQAAHEHMGLRPFLESGVGTGFWAERAVEARSEAVFGWRWLGDPLHVVLVFAVLYALVRVAGARHRLAATIALPAAWAWAWLAPSIADHPFRPETSATGIATFVVAAALTLVVVTPEEDAPTRSELARLVIWAAPSVILWIVYAGYDTRLLSAAWPPLILLMGSIVTMSLVGGGRVSPVLPLVPAAALVWLALANVVALDGLGSDGWRQYRAAGVSGLANGHLMENIALAQFQWELDALRGSAKPSDRVIGGDGRLGFFFPGRVDTGYPRSCEALKGHQLFVLLTADESVAQARAAGAPATADEWRACRSPHLTVVASAETFVVFRIA